MPKKTISTCETPDGKFIVVDDEVFDWGLEPEDLERAMKLAKNSDMLKKTVQRDIREHFMDSFAEFLGKAVSLKELNEAIESGWIEA
jgi:hypothetical protein